MLGNNNIASKGDEKMSRLPEDSMESKLEKLRRKARKMFNYAEDTWIDIIYTFEDAFIMRDYESDKMFEVPYAIDGETKEVELGEPREVETIYVIKRLAEAMPEKTLKELNTELAVKGQGAELTGPIVMKDNVQRIAFAAVLVPGEPDHDFKRGEKILTEGEIERVANQWLADYANIDLQHTLNNCAVPVQSYVTYSDREVTDHATGKSITLPKGTWILGSRHDEATWKQIESGELTGYSVMGIRKAALKSLDATTKSTDALDTASFKRTLLRDLGDDWVAPYVSVVDEPCVPKAKWFALKRREAEAEIEERTGFLTKALEALGVLSVDKEGKRWSKDRYKKLQEIQKTINEFLEEAEAERRETADKQKREEESEVDEATVKSIVTEAIKELKNELIANKEKKPTLDAAEGTPEPESAVKEEETKDEFQEEVLKRLEKLEKRSVGSRAIKGQDGVAKEKEDTVDPDRDLYGRRRKGGK